MTKKVLACVGVFILLLITAVICAPYVPEVKTTGVVTSESHTMGVVTIGSDGRTGPVEIDKYMEVEFNVGGIPYKIYYNEKYQEDCLQYVCKHKGDEVEVYYNPIFPFINRLA